jgi:glycosyltransferase involved in cell wall biosynthesis
VTARVERLVPGNGGRPPTWGDARPLRIAMLAPPWIAIPPPGYGGIEQVIALLSDELVRRGNEVVLFAAPGSRSLAEVLPLLGRAHDDAINEPGVEIDHVARAFAAIESMASRGRPVDVVHDHCGFTALAMADRLATPLVHTVHGPFVDDNRDFYAAHAHKAGAMVGLSAAQLAEGPPALRSARMVSNPIGVDAWPFVAQKDDYVLWIGRMSPVKGPQRAIAAARAADVPLVLAGPVQRGQEEFFAREVKPCVDGVNVTYVGEVSGAPKQDLFARARTLLMPIRWSEPFGLVMVEAMACGTPVIAFPEGAAPEIVADGETGLLVADEHEMAAAIGRVGELDAARCREHVRERFDVSAVAASYESAYRAAIRSRPSAARRDSAAAETQPLASLPQGL